MREGVMGMRIPARKLMIVTAGFAVLFLLSLLFGTIATAAPAKEVAVESKISLIPENDLNHNGQIDGGDLVKFSYSVKNPTNKDYPFARLDTHIDRSKLNFVHNIIGSSSLKQEGTITFPNISIPAGKTIEISFDARINFQDQDFAISTEPELVAKDKQVLIVAKKTEKQAKKTDLAKLKGETMLKPKGSNQ